MNFEYAARAYPPINDITTDTVDPPTFWDVPHPVIYPGEQVAALQRQGYPDLKPLELGMYISAENGPADPRRALRAGRHRSRRIRTEETDLEQSRSVMVAASTGRRAGKERAMDIADILIHFHADLSPEQWTAIEEAVSACDGVISVHFSRQHAHELTVAYDPAGIDSQVILEQVHR